jgi:hypothetical protein
VATTDVPGSNPANGDRLVMGAWAEHADGSRLFVEGMEGGLVTYSMFDMSKRPVVEYRDRMAEVDFRQRFAPTAGPKPWTWHDKTPFPWDAIIREGAQPGVRLASAADQLTLAHQIADSLNLRARVVTTPELEQIRNALSRMEQHTPNAAAALQQFLEALSILPSAPVPPTPPPTSTP